MPVEQVLAKAHRQLDLGLLKSAEALLRQRVASLGPAPPVSSGSPRLTALLAEVYYRSGQYDDALAAALQCRAYLDRQAAASADREIRGQQQNIAQLLIRVYMARNLPGSDGQAGRRVPSDRQQAEQVLAAAVRTAEQASPVSQLELLVLRAELAESGPSATADKQRVRDCWSEAERRARTFTGRLDRGQTEMESYANGVRLHARCLAALGRYREAVSLLQQLASGLEQHHPLSRETWSEIARVYGLARDSAREIAAWQYVLKLHAARRERIAHGNTLEAADCLSDEADDRCRLAQAVRAAVRPAEAAAELQQSKTLYQRALESLRRPATPAYDPGEVKAQQAVALQGLLEVGQEALGSQGRQQVELSDELLPVALQLHRLLEESLLGGDPRIFLLKVNLAARYVRAGDFDQTRPYLVAARQFYGRCQPPNPLMLVRIANLRCEVERGEGAIEAAETALNEAVDLYRREHLADEHLWLAVKLNQGRLAAAAGRYALAERHFGEVIERADRASPPAEESLCLALLNRGVLYKSLSRFDRAEQFCRQAFERRRARLPPDHPDLLAYYVAMAAIQLDSGNPSRARETVSGALAVCKANRLEQTPLGSQARHQRALLHFLDYETTRSAADAQAAGRLWEDLLALQVRRHWRLEQAQTLHYLSRLRFLQWRREIEQAARDRGQQKSEAYRQAHAAYQRENDQYVKRLAAYQSDKEQYEAALDVYTRRKGPFAEREQRYQDLAKWHAKLDEAKRALSLRHQDLLLQQAALRKAHQDNAAKPTAQGTAGPADARLAEAGRLAAQAVQLLAEIRLYPNLHYLALCNRAEILRARAGEDQALGREAIQSLAKAVDLLERPRLATAGRDVVRAEFFARYAAAFDLLVAWLVEDHRPEEALVYAELGRNRTFLDRIRADGIQLADSLEPADRHLTEEEQRLLSRCAALSAELGRSSGKDSSESAEDQRRRQSLQRELDELYQRYGAVRREICSRSQVYQHVLAKPLVEEEVRRVVDRWVRAAEPSLYYYVGTSGGFVFLSGIEPGKVDVFRLRSSDLELSGYPPGNVSAGSIAVWVQLYMDVLGKGSLTSTLRRTGPRLVGITETLVPRELRDRMRAKRPQQPGHLTIFPDGRLYQLPFEALVVEAGQPARFLVDEFRPLAFCYAPSIMILDALGQKRAAADGGAARVVSLARPDFSNISRQSGPVALRYLEILGVDSLADLRRTEGESESLLQAFGRDRVSQLRRQTATEAALRGELARAKPALLHLATHGIAADEGLQTEGALALALPSRRQTDPADDGFLELPEIYRLPLASCELAVLSACNTNIGKQRPLEMGATLSRAFLSAGARRVVASQWPVADEPTALLMERFFAEIAAAARKGGPCDYSTALQKARDELRRADNGRWGDPYFWAPFVLLGPAAVR